MIRGCCDINGRWSACAPVLSWMTVVVCFPEGKSLRDEDILHMLPVGTTACFYFNDLGSQVTWGTVSVNVHPYVHVTHTHTSRISGSVSSSQQMWDYCGSFRLISCNPESFFPFVSACNENSLAEMCVLLERKVIHHGKHFITFIYVCAKVVLLLYSHAVLHRGYFWQLSQCKSWDPTLSFTSFLSVSVFACLSSGFWFDLVL